MIKHITDIRKEVIDVFESLKNGTIDAKVASEMLNAAGKVTAMCHLQIKYHSLRKESPDMPFIASNGK